MKVFTAETAPKFVPLIVRYVDARTDCAPVRQDGRAQDVLKVIVLYAQNCETRVLIWPSNIGKIKKKFCVCYVGEIFSLKIQLEEDTMKL